MATLTVQEILKQVRRIQIVANRQVSDLMAGSYHSVFKGRGMEFEEVREYQPGDEIRTIDWNVTARTGEPFVKRFSEERELTVLFLVDVSASGMFGSVERSKLELATEVAALLMFTALKNNDKVGLILFADDVLRYLPPRKGKGAVLRCVRELVSAEPVPRETNLHAAVDFVAHVQKRRGIVFLISDFLAPLDPRALAVAKHRHDLIAVSVADPREEVLPDVGFMTLSDPETGERYEIDTRSKAVRMQFEERAREREVHLATTLRRAGVDRLDVRTGKPYATDLMRFFRMRERRLHA